jgi:DNA repair exonuclease SbcCD ATPase subunit
MAKPSTSIDEEIFRLYELPPEEFTAARDAAAKGLKADGRGDDAQTIKGLRKPTVAAWAVNRTVREHRADVDELLWAGEGLRRAQRKALSGVREAGLREAADARRKALARVVKAAEAELRGAGLAPASHREAVEATFDSASVDEEAADLVTGGRLAKELPPPAGFGGVEGFALVPPPREPKARPAPPAKGPKAEGPKVRGKDAAAERRKAELEALKAERREVAQEAKAAQKDAADARKQADKASREAEKAGGEAERLKQEAERLKQEAEAARGRARDAGRFAQKAATDATRAEDAAERAGRRLQEVDARLKDAEGQT